MTFTKSFSTVGICAASCLLWAFSAVNLALGQEEIFPGMSPPTANGPGWTASTGRWTAVRRASYDQTASVPNNTPEPPPTFPQIKNPLDTPHLEEPSAEARQGGNLPTAEACPECGGRLEPTGFCDRCARSGGKLLHLLSPRRWLEWDRQKLSQREPWHYRPFSVGLFMGPIVGSPLISDSIEQGTGFLGGARFGYDFDEDWGLEMRLASASFPVSGGYPIDGTQHSSDHFLWDIDFLYYPWEDAAIRPYVLMGIGTARIKFADQLGNDLNRIMVGMPIGVGVKLRLSDWFIFRIECLDNVAFAGGSNFGTQQNFSITGGLEIRFGRPHIQYWPWNPGMRE